MTQPELVMEPCMDAHKGNCTGEVDFYATPGRIKAFPRCEKHWAERMDRWERNEMPLTGDVAPSWFDPTYAGEEW